jgi:HEAT repeat protein
MKSKFLYCLILFLPLVVSSATRTGELSELLKNGSVQERREAAISLGETGDPLAVHPLIEALRQPKYISEKAAESLVRIGSASVKPLIDRLEETTDRDLQKKILKLLGEIGDKKAIEPLLHALGDENHRTVISIIISYSHFSPISLLNGDFYGKGGNTEYL